MRGRSGLTRGRVLAVFAVLLAAACSISAFDRIAAALGPDYFQQLEYRFIGPRGNRFAAVTGVHGQPKIIYAGAASGGIFKSSDGGVTWTPIFDDQRVSSVSALAVSPSNPDIIWAGTGETFIRNLISVGIGVFKSADAGRTWAHVGLPDSGRIPRIVLHPANPDIAFVAVMGHSHGPQKDKGIYRTRDGGKTWQQVLFVDEMTGCSDLVMDPNDPNVLLAGMWSFQMTHWSRHSGITGGGGLFRSTDGGTTWKRLTAGLPPQPVGKIAVAMSRSDSKRMYALIESLEGTLWRSDDGGDNWRRVSENHDLMDRPSYYTRLAVSPANASELYTVCNGVHVSTDGGDTFRRMSLKGGDNHDMWIDSKDPDHMLVANDQYIAITVNRGATWNGVSLPNAQMYHVAVDNQIPYYVYGNKQDGASYRGPSNSRQRTIPSVLWHSVGGAEAGFAIPDPVDNNIVWASNYQGILDRYDVRTGHARGVAVWREDNIGHPPKDLKYRFQWTFPIVISPHDHNTVYVGSQYVHVTTNGGQSWKVVSPDLTTSAPDMLERNWGPLVAESADPSMSCTLFALAESPVEKGQIWAGSNDGLLHVTRDGGKTWTNVTANVPGLPARAKITNVHPSRHDPGTCYFAADAHEVNNWATHVYRTTDYGKTWKNITAGIPGGYLSFAHCIREDPVRRGLLYLGTENELYVSLDDGGKWLPLGAGLPPAPVHWIEIQEHFNDLVVATFGRGFYILDDITPLQQATEAVLASDVHLFVPRPAYRFLQVEANDVDVNDTCAGKDPQYGASINYFLSSVPQGDIVVTILDEKGQRVRALTGPREVGINRVMWDLRYDTPEIARLRTPPLDEHTIPLGPEGWRPLIQYSGGPIDVRVPPGTYTVRLSAGGKNLEQRLTVRKDPSSAGSEADVVAQTEVMLRIRRDQDNLIGMINTLESLRQQAYRLRDKLGKEPDGVLSALGKFDAGAIGIEEKLFQMRVTARADTLRWPSGLVTKFSTLAREVSRADFRPTDQQMELLDVLENQLAGLSVSYRELTGRQLSDLNNLLRASGIQPGLAVPSKSR